MYVQFTSCVYWDVTVCHECFKKVSRVTKNEDIIFHTISLYDCQFGKILITTGVKPLIWSPGSTEYLGLISQNFITALSNASINFLKAYNWLFILFGGIPTDWEKSGHSFTQSWNICKGEPSERRWSMRLLKTNWKSKYQYHVREETSWHLLVQSLQWKHQNNMWNLVKVNNKDSKTTSLTSFGCLYCWL